MTNKPKIVIAKNIIKTSERINRDGQVIEKSVSNSSQEQLNQIRQRRAAKFGLKA